MGAPQRRSYLALARRLFEEPYRFDFFQAVRLLERAYKEAGAPRQPVGGEGPPEGEVVRFAARLTLEFPPSAIHALEGPRPRPGGAADGPPTMETAFLGQVGPLGVLPAAYTESLIAPEAPVTPGGPPRDTRAALDFLNLFHHRVVSLFYRAWEKYNVPALWERGDGSGDDPFSRRLFDLVGLTIDDEPDQPLRDRMTVPDRALTFYAAAFAQQSRPASVLEGLLRDYFGLPVQVLQFQGRWLYLPESQLTRAGRGGAFNRLGIDAMIGSKTWDDQGMFRVRVGPLGFDDFLSLQPGGRTWVALTDLVRFFVRGALEFEVQPVLRAEEVPECEASRDGRKAARLGRTAWLRGRRPFARDADDAVFLAPAGAAARAENPAATAGDGSPPDSGGGTI